MICVRHRFLMLPGRQRPGFPGDAFMFGWAATASALLRRSALPGADNSALYASIAVKNFPRCGKRMSWVVRLYLDTWVGPRTSLPGEADRLGHHDIAMSMLSYYCLFDL